MLTSTSVPPSVNSDTCPYFPSSVPYYFVTVVQPYSENVAPFSFNVLITFLPKHFKNFISQVSAANRVKKKLYLSCLVTYN